VVGRRAALLAVTAALAAGCGTDGRPTEAEQLESYVGLVQAQQFALEAGAAAGYPEAREQLPEVRRRAKAAREATEEAGATPPLPPERVAEVDDVLPGLGEVRSRGDFERFASELAAAEESARADLPVAIP
jgi:hypothetical protein